mmetsp:Transcript_8069/g.14955  ORF Transcript_8069/g.14955 Transcript_8069/m.14955 type:complete len:264 (-) Transcript_8069:259-1050(-)|eukprot:CAMPEP_0197535656 /NCGR_PEP_ID=MMETSP1318-20131121/51293_1 /TAXON_ID=552666 /ORGANISM="Partenskyella glossopodia, Strain RCC365" /LENGTH=263 /DNA_ID=CAMNT_0043093297 /DNA_START=154 /DNA_END=945 /DNA_ORIENTATION=-
MLRSILPIDMVIIVKTKGFLTCFSDAEVALFVESFHLIERARKRRGFIYDAKLAEVSWLAMICFHHVGKELLLIHERRLQLLQVVYAVFKLVENLGKFRFGLPVHTRKPRGVVEAYDRVERVRQLMHKDCRVSKDSTLHANDKNRGVLVSPAIRIGIVLHISKPSHPVLCIAEVHAVLFEFGLVAVLPQLAILTVNPDRHLSQATEAGCMRGSSVLENLVVGLFVGFVLLERVVVEAQVEPSDVEQSHERWYSAARTAEETRG